MLRMVSFTKYRGNSVKNRNGRMVIALHSLVFVYIRGRSQGFAYFRNMFLKFVKTHIRNIFGSSSQAILINGNASVVIVRRL